MRSLSASIGALAVLVSACTTGGLPGARPDLPDWAKGEMRTAALEEVDLSDVTRYRALARDDFRGASPPAALASHREQLGATTCAYVKPSGQARTQIQGPLPGASRSERYEVVLQEVHFEAVMDRRCSWWNERSRLSEEYVLQHEQIHFALAELAARRLDAEVARLAGNLRTRGPTPQAATEKLGQQVEAVMARALEALFEESNRFDEDTSGRHDPVKQQEWWERVQRDLAETAAR